MVCAGTSALSPVPHSTRHLPPPPHMAWGGPGKPLCLRTALSPYPALLFCGMKPCFRTVLFVVPHVLSFIHSLKQLLAGTAQGAPIQPQRTEPARAGKGAGTALMRYYRRFHSSSPQSMFILSLCDYLVNPGQRGSPSGKQKLHGVKASVQTVPG